MDAGKTVVAAQGSVENTLLHQGGPDGSARVRVAKEVLKDIGDIR